MENLPIIIGAVVVLLAAIATVGYFLSRPKPATAPKRDTDDTWDLYLAGSKAWTDRDREAIEALRRLPQTEVDRIRASVNQTQTEALASPDPQAALRRAVMDSTDRFVLADVHRDDGQSTGPGDLESTVEAGVLRCAAQRRFGDYDKNDWYAHYLNVAQMNSRNVAAMVRKTVQGETASFESALHDPLTRTMAEVRRTLLTHPPRTPVERSDKLTSAAETLRLTPTQHQIDELTRIMGNRFEKLFAGQVYRLEHGTADPTGSFQVDAGLLYTILSINFRHPTDAWRHIMGEALGDYRAAMDDEQRLLALARDCCSTWEQHRGEGPLGELLKTGCRGAFPGDEGWETIATGMTEDASFLSGQIQRVVKS